MIVQCDTRRLYCNATARANDPLMQTLSQAECRSNPVALDSGLHNHPTIMNWKTTLVCGALAMAPLGCDTDSSGDEDGHSETEGEEDDHGHDHGHDHGEEELITTVTLTFTSDAGDTVTAEFTDPDGQGGNSGTAEPIVLAPNTTYTLSIELFNDLESEDVTPEIEAEAEEHQFIIYGSSVTGPGSMGSGLVTHAYADVESDYGENAVGDDLPVGLSNTITTSDAGAGDFSVMLRHVPETNDQPQKAAGLAEGFAGGGEPAGSADVDVTFELTVE